MAECKLLIRHPLLWRPEPDEPPRHVSLHGAPPEVLQHVASFLDTARDLLSLAAVCKATQCAPRAHLSSLRGGVAAWAGAARATRALARGPSQSVLTVRARARVPPRPRSAAVAHDERLWRALTLRVFPVPKRADPPTPGGWRGLYRRVPVFASPRAVRCAPGGSCARRARPGGRHSPPAH